MKKQLIIAALLLALAVLAFMLLYTVTVYPAFQKSVGSIDTLRQALRSDAILYPAVENLLQEPNYTLSLDGRTVFAKPVGYVIDGTEPYAETEIYYLFTGSTTPHSSQTTVEEIAYRDVPIRRWDHGSLNDSGALYRVNLTFSQDGYFYTLSASVRRSCAATRGAAHARIANRTGHACAGHAPIAVPADDRRILNL